MLGGWFSVSAGLLGILLMTALVSVSAQTNTFPSTGNVGIGTLSPGAKLDVEGVNNQIGLDISGNSGGYAGSDINVTRTSSETGVGNAPNIQFNDTGSGSYNIIQGSSSGLQFISDYASSGWIERMRIASSGYIGIGTTNPWSPLDVRNTSTPKTSGLYALLASFYSNDPINPFGLSMTFNGAANLANRVVSLQTQDANLANGGSLSLQPAGGNVGIGTIAPRYPLSVNGVIQSTLGGVMFPDGTTQNTAWTGVLCGGDYAESVGVSGERNRYEPGEVLVIDLDNPDGFAKSTHPYSTVIAGIYSTKPGVVGRKSADPDKAKTEIPMAMVGIVPTKVSAENGPIKRGDLLVTSATLGHAMKGTDRSQMLGAIVGKALGPLNSGTGVIDVLVTLQ
jgi:hypothetical protein